MHEIAMTDLFRLSVSALPAPDIGICLFVLLALSSGIIVRVLCRLFLLGLW